MQDASLADHTRAVDPASVYALVGDFDLSNCHLLEAEIMARIQAADSAYLDFTRCTYIDSSVLTVLVRMVRNFGDRLQMQVQSGSNIARLFEVTQLDRLFPIV